MKNLFCLCISLLLCQNLLAQQPFITTWKTDNLSTGSSNSTSITIPTANFGYNYDVDWDNDGIYEQTGITGTGRVTHNYGTAGTYTIRIKGNFPRIYFNNTGDKNKILSIEQWGDIAWANMNGAFRGCVNLAGNATDNPNLSAVTDMSTMFNGASNFNQNISAWNVSTVTNMASMFRDATAFNQNIGSWNVSAVTNMASMFYNAPAFNQNIGNWNVSAVTNMSQMFYNAIAFNQNIGSWNVSAVTNMYQMFYRALVFNQNIGSWNVSAVKDMSYMFFEATAFNQNIGNWNVGAVTDMNEMFAFAHAFNQDISAWNVSVVTDMAYMFRGSIAFNQNIGSWNVSAVTNMNGMFNGSKVFNQNIGSWNVSAVTNMAQMFFGAIAFNQNIGSWNVSAVNNMSQMFYDAKVFNQNIGSWNVSAVNNMSEMFYNAIAFNQNIGSWNVSAVTNMFQMFNNATAFNQNIGDWNIAKATDMSNIFNDSGISKSNYDNILIAWNTGGYINKNLGNVSPLKYYAGQAARTNLITNKGWTMSGDAYEILAPTGTANASVWENKNASLSATCATGNVVWYAANSTTLLFTGSPFVTPNLMVNTTYTVRCEGGGFNSPFVVVMVTVLSRPFISTWKTDNLSSGSSNSTSITIPIIGSGHNYDVDWDNDGVYDQTGITGSVTRNYATAGTYTIRIRGNFPRIYFNNTGDRYKILSIQQWGDIAWASMSFAFTGCVNLAGNASDNPNLSAVTSMSNMFSGASSFNQNVSSWNVNSVMNMNRIFFGATAFNQNIGAWNITNATTMGEIFRNSGISKSNYDNILMAWNSGGYLNKNLGDASPLTYCAGQAARTNMITNRGWIISSDTFSSSVLAPTGTSNPTICNNTSVLLSATCATGNVVWYASNSSTQLSTGSSFVTPNLTANTTYNVRCEDTGCNGSFMAVNITITPQNLNLVSPTDDIVSGNVTRKASLSISATNKIGSPASMLYQAGNLISLNAGFESAAGTVFRAEIGACVN